MTLNELRLTDEEIDHIDCRPFIRGKSFDVRGFALAVAQVVEAKLQPVIQKLELRLVECVSPDEAREAIEQAKREERERIFTEIERSFPWIYQGVNTKPWQALKGIKRNTTQDPEVGNE